MPLVIDADGLTALGHGRRRPGRCWRGRTAPRCSPRTTASTPGWPDEAPGEDRLAAARDLAARIGAIVLLKGPLTAVATDQQRTPDVLLSAAGVPALATAGTGDVLSGVIGAFLARGVPAHAAAALAAHVHGRAGRTRTRGRIGGR